MATAKVGLLAVITQTLKSHHSILISFIRLESGNVYSHLVETSLLLEVDCHVISWMFNFETLKFIPKFNSNLIPKIKPEHLNEISRELPGPITKMTQGS